MNIPDIEDDQTLIAVLDELKHRLKIGPWTELKLDFNAVLNAFIEEHQLNKDPHNFAALPEIL